MGLDLVTLTEYKVYAGITSTTQDTLINNLIPIVSNFTKTFCARSFVDYVDDPKIEVFKGGQPKLLMSEYPLIAVSSVEYSNDFGLTYSSLTEFTDYVVDNEDSSIQAIAPISVFPIRRKEINTEAYTFPEKTNAYKVTYTAGFDPLPSDLKVAVLDLLGYYLRSDMAVKSQRTAGSSTVQVEYITKNTLPAHIGRVFDIYTSAWN
jgi:hypothetical protein